MADNQTELGIKREKTFAEKVLEKVPKKLVRFGAALGIAATANLGAIKAAEGKSITTEANKAGLPTIVDSEKQSSVIIDPFPVIRTGEEPPFAPKDYRKKGSSYEEPRSSEKEQVVNPIVVDQIEIRGLKTVKNETDLAKFKDQTSDVYREVSGNKDYQELLARSDQFIKDYTLKHAGEDGFEYKDFGTYVIPIKKNEGVVIGTVVFQVDSNGVPVSFITLPEQGSGNPARKIELPKNMQGFFVSLVLDKETGKEVAAIFDPAGNYAVLNLPDGVPPTSTPTPDGPHIVLAKYEATPDGNVVANGSEQFASAEKVVSVDLLSESTTQKMSADRLKAEKMTDGITFRPIGSKSNWEVVTNMPGLELEDVDFTDLDLRIKRLQAEGALNSDKTIKFEIIREDNKWIDGSIARAGRGSVPSSQIVVEDTDRIVFKIYLNSELYKQAAKAKNPAVNVFNANMETTNNMLVALSLKYGPVAVGQLYRQGNVYDIVGHMVYTADEVANPKGYNTFMKVKYTPS